MRTVVLSAPPLPARSKVLASALFTVPPAKSASLAALLNTPCGGRWWHVHTSVAWDLRGGPSSFYPQAQRLKCSFF